jgi:ADP-heptose:LPS heptosyltransferase
MAGIYPVPLPACPTAARELPAGLEDRQFVLLIPGSSPRHPDKRWPASHYAELSRLLFGEGFLPVVVGAPDEQHIAAAIRAICPEVVDLVGQTALVALANLAKRAAFTVGNDTGATHMAAAGRNPVVVLFSRASEPSRCAPRGGLVRVLTKPDLAHLAVETVFAEAIEVFAASADDSQSGTADD